ncbi:hypothetical protein [Pseudoalteromonas aurantia]|nr:hypothetical protein [Pseudoalteromonas aurantia]
MRKRTSATAMNTTVEQLLYSCVLATSPIHAVQLIESFTKRLHSF